MHPPTTTPDSPNTTTAPAPAGRHHFRDASAARAGTGRTGVGRHRRPASHAGVALLVVAAATAAGLVLSPVASADPGQGGVTGGNTGQSGVTGGAGGQGGVTGGTTPAPAPAPEPEIIPAQTQQYLPGYTASPTVQEYGYRSYETDYSTDSYSTSYYDSTYYESAPTTPQIISDDPATEVVPAPQPAPIPTVQKKVIRPIKAPENTVLVGGNAYVRPDFVDPVFADQFNNTTQAIQADGANALMNAGLADAPQADRLAAGTAAGALTGAATGLAVGLVPSAAITAAGTAIGAGLGVAATPVLTPAIIWAGPIGYVFVPGAAALAGAGVGAAISAPIVATTTVIGAGVGALVGATAAGGEDAIIDEPAPLPAPSPEPEPEPEPAPAPQAAPAPAPLADITAAVPDASEAVSTVQNVIDQATTQAPAAVETARTAITQDPAGTQIVSAVDSAVAQAAPVLDQARSAIDAAIAGLPA
ncbi:MAG: hypothetical protein WBD41_17715 [Rhodococcus sp. (in: high G+C Gram-positive bacteria)]